MEEVVTQVLAFLLGFVEVSGFRIVAEPDIFFDLQEFGDVLQEEDTGDDLAEVLATL